MLKAFRRTGTLVTLCAFLFVIPGSIVRAQVLLSADFENGSLNGWGTAGQVNIVTSTFIQGSHALENSWPSGANYARITHPFPESSTVYYRAYWKASTGFTFSQQDSCPNNTAQKKFMEINKNEYDSRIGIFMEPDNRCGHGALTGRMKFVATKTTGNDLGASWNMFPDGSCSACPPGGHRNQSTNPEVRLTGGQWYCIEIGIHQAGAGVSAGSRAQVWVDGVLQVDVQDEQLGASSNWISLDGEMNGGAEQAQREWWDNIIVSSERVGCGTVPPSDPPPPDVTGVTRTDIHP